MTIHPTTRRTTMTAGLAGLLALGATSVALAAPKVGTPAPAFSATDADGRKVSLSDYRGKTVVIEWTNDECPFVRKHYGSHAMQDLQAKWTGRGVVWLSVISSAPGEQGNVTAAEENAYLQQMHAAPTAVILDPSGAIGRLYGAKTTPHMFVIDPGGKLIYQGAIDDQPSPDPATLQGAKNFVSAALTEAMSGKPVTTPQTRSYGCSVKYGG